LKSENNWAKEGVVKLFLDMIPNFKHKERRKYLDGKM
jgi:hypothetical protein